jgi:Ca2+-binding RTX toxin-like protein
MPLPIGLGIAAMPLFTLTPGSDDFPLRGQDTTGDDTICGLAGDDTIDGGRGADRVQGGIGNDVLVVRLARRATVLEAESLYGGQGDDLILIDTSASGYATAGAGMVLSGGVGFDVVRVQSHDFGINMSAVTFEGIERLQVTGNLQLSSAQVGQFDTIVVGTEHVPRGLSLADNSPAVVHGLLKVNYLGMADGGQTLDLSAATFRGTSGYTFIWGGTGDDTIITGELGGGPRITGKRGDDTMIVASKTYQDASYYGGKGADSLVGAAFNDTLLEDEGRDTIHGNGGADNLFGGQRGDLLFGGDGDDTLWGGDGRDTITGGDGADTFILLGDNAPRGARSVVMTIADFTVNPGPGQRFVDRIDLRYVEPRGPYEIIGGGPFSAAHQIRVWQDGADAIVEVNATDAPGAEWTLRLLNVDAAQLDTADFIF